MQSLKLYLTAILFLTIVYTGRSQTRWSIGVYATSSITKIDDVYNHDYRPAYGIGIRSIYFPTSQLFLKAGLSYMTKNSIIKNIIPDTRNLIDPNGALNPDAINYFDITYNYHFLSIPLTVNYMLPNKKKKRVSLFISTGIELSYLFKNRITSPYLLIENQSQSTNRGDINGSLGTGINTGIGLFYKISPKLILLTEPDYTYDFYSTQDRDKFHSFGLNLELHYILK